MVDVRGDVLRPPHGTTPAAVKSNKNQKWDFEVVRQLQNVFWIYTYNTCVSFTQFFFFFIDTY